MQTTFAPPPTLRRTAAALLERDHRHFLLMTIAAVMLPLVAWIAAIVYERQALLARGEQTARTTVAALAEHMDKVLETHSLVLEQVDAQIVGRTWEEIEGDANLRRSLNSVAQKFPQARAIWIVDETGRRRQYGTTNGQVYAEDVSVADRDYFLRHKSATGERIFISQPFTGASGARMFTVSIRRSSPDGRFAGVVLISVGLDYLTSVWKQVAPEAGHVIPLVRSDGVVIARHPTGEPAAALSPTAPFMRQIAASPAGGFYTAVSRVDGIERLNAFRRVDGYPLYISFSLEKAAVLAPWRSRAVLYGLGALAGMAALLGFIWSALRHAIGVADSARAWQESARQLESEIRRRERAEAELVQAQKMEAVGQLTGGIAHDFNNLLHAMSLNLHMLERTSAGAPGERFMQSIRRALDRAAQLTRQLTAFSRRQRLEPRTFAPGELLVRMGDLLARTLGGKVEIRLDSAPDVGTIHADPAQTELAVLNLAVNARDAMAEGGVLTLRARNHVGAPGEPRFIELSVADTGSGMPEDVVQRAFEPFFTTKEVGKGSGLGLSMVHGFATQSGGSVALASQPGRGTTVTLLLPAGGPQAEPLDPERGTSGVERSSLGGRVLLVDDDSLVRASMLLALQAAGFQVDEAANANEALDQLRRAPADVLVTDFAMPGMTGAELARISRSIAPGMPIVLVTGYAQPGLGMHSVDGVDVVLHKPFGGAELVQHLDRLLWKQAKPRQLAG
jgi:signal transduction histidine kinase